MYMCLLRLSALLDKNFDTRRYAYAIHGKLLAIKYFVHVCMHKWYTILCRKVYGDPALGEANLEMIEIARKVCKMVHDRVAVFWSCMYLSLSHTHTHIHTHTLTHTLPLSSIHDTQHGSSAKFSGSGGAIIGVCLDPAKKVGL